MVTKEFCARCTHKASDHFENDGYCGQPAKRGPCKCPRPAIGVAPYSTSREYTTLMERLTGVRA